VTYGPTRSHWTAAGFAGTNFGNSTNERSITFGGEVGYLWHGMLGVEALGDFAPSFKLDNPTVNFGSTQLTLLSDNPRVYSYMANAVGVLPLGSEGQFQPFVSGGVGGITLRASVCNPFCVTNPIDGIPSTFSTNTENHTRLGWDVGGGLMFYAGRVGLRGDVRWYRASTDNSISAASTITQQLVSAIDFWRANIGVTFQWPTR
jgi:opacity protein-like surface antigen